MRKKEKKKVYRRKLDNQAKVFALASNYKYSSVFRLSVILTEKIDEKLLQKAVKLTLKKYKAFKVKMRKGFSWNYLEENKEEPFVSIESEYPFKKVNTKENNNYLFKVTYFENKVNIEIFHALTDASGGKDFFKEIIYRYLELKHPEELEGKRLKEEIVWQDTENAYIKNYKKDVEKPRTLKRSYKIRGEKLPEGQIRITHINVDLEKTKKLAKEQESRFSAYLVALIAYSIYETKYRISDDKRNINICVPVDLKKYFKTDTISNFFSYMMIVFPLRKDRIYTFDEILDISKKEFEKKFKVNRIIETVTSVVGKTRNPFVRIVPLFIKKGLVQLGSFSVKRRFTMTVSNIGIIDFDEQYSKYIDKSITILSPDWAEKIKCGICSHKNNLGVTFATNLKDDMIEEKFVELLKEKEVEIKIEKNTETSNIYPNL